MGIIRAMAEIGPSPGNKPINVPTKQPAKTIKRFVGVNAVLSPNSIPSNMIFYRGDEFTGGMNLLRGEFIEGQFIEELETY